MLGDALLRGAREVRSTLVEPEPWLKEWLGGGRTKSGVAVTEERALRQSAVAACVRVVSETVGMLPCLTYERLDADSIREAPEHPYARTFALSPNPEMTAIEFWENFTAYGMLWAHSAAYINRRRNGDVELWPLPPNLIELAREPVPTGTPGKVTPGPITGLNVRLANGEKRFVRWRDVLMHKPFSYAGTKTPIQRHAETIGLALAAEEYGARYFAQGASTGGFIKMPPDATEPQAKRTEANFRAQREGLERSHLIGVLEGGAEWVEVGLNPSDSQLIEVRQFGVEEIARSFRVPLSKIQHLLRAHFANIEHESLGFVTDTIGPWTTRHMQAVRRDVWGTDKYGKAGDRWSAHRVRDLLRGDAESVAKANAIAVQWGWRNRNEVRREEERAPFEGGDEFLTPLNMGSIDELLNGDDEDSSRVVKLAALMSGRTLPNGNNNGHSDRAPDYLAAE